ncbi:DJ-1/PfpI family protein [Planococcus sp. 11815]|uniref:DJ-1/PfpI family protein n=1 Tax=Planococcus sp. 11815 TaxID=2939413 RepID=UPI003DA369E8
MNEKVLFVLLDEYADWEAASLAAALNEEPEGEGRRFDVKTVSLTKEPVRSIGGFTVVPDYSIDDAPEEFARIDPHRRQFLAQRRQRTRHGADR